MRLPTLHFAPNRRAALAAALATCCFLFSSPAPAQTFRSDAELTQIIREVNLLLAQAAPRKALLHDRIGEGTSVKTGGASRAELTITRLGAYTLYRFKKAGRDIDFTSGEMLLRVPKNCGGALIHTSGVTAGITGTTILFEFTRSGTARLTVLEGTAEMRLVRFPDQRRAVRAGESLTVPPGATSIPQPSAVDLNRVMKTSPLVSGFPPLPSRDAINAAINQQQRTGQAAGGQPNNQPPAAAQPAPAGRRP